ncbi:MAG: DNA replication and repair protein RecF [Puniceicoccales bacterium]|jgi:DNA replication and repair protein RecF|nr:DNA replication and repair protein RecF [Puniceicoccales bacterium]
MFLRLLRLSDFRNIGFAEVPLGHRRCFLLGANGQGKTNLLEATGLLPALRSFRTRDVACLVRHGATAAQAGYVLEHEREGEVEIAVTLDARAGTRSVSIAGGRIRRLAEYLGRFPAVPFCAADIELLRGSPAGRRRWLDLLLASENPAYFEALRRYHAALAQRNQLLKNAPAPDHALLASFEKIMAPEARTLAAARADALGELGDAVRVLCGKMGVTGDAGVNYKPDAAPAGGDWERLLAAQRRRDLLLGATQRGPQRDDFEFHLGGHPARETASEGQQRALVLALELAWLERLRAAGGAPAPLVLADDILGELDPQRRAGFWATLGDACQVIATGTTPPPDPENWHIIHVESGTFRPAN